MTKKEFILKQIAKTNKKNDENYVVTRLWHKLDRLDLKMITQQHITLINGRALTDVFFPQIGLHIEVDESHHFYSKSEIEIKNGKMNNEDIMELFEMRGLRDKDIQREADITNATGHEVQRIIVWKQSIEEVNKRVDELVDLINLKVNEKGNAGEFEEWDIEAEYNPQTYIDKGKILVEDNVAFNRIYDACNCFGHDYLGYQRGFANHPKDDTKMIWFPKLYENSEWENSISNDEETIYEKKNGDHGEHEEYFNNIALVNNDNKKERIVFARVKGVLGDTMYRFKGVYKLNVDKSKNDGRVIYERVSKEAKTYPNDN